MKRQGRRTDFRSSAGERAGGKRQWLDLNLRPRYASWKESLADVLRLVGHFGVTRATVGEHTQAKRRAELFLMFETLERLGHRLQDVRQLKGRHVEHLVTHWDQEGHEASTIQGRQSTLRWLATWLGKEGMVLPATAYVADPARVKRRMVAQTDRSWSANDVDSLSVVDEVTKTDPRVGIQLAMSRAFGLRAREAMMFRPHVDDHGAVLHIRHGTKGGRDRVVPVKTPEQRAVVDQAKGFAATKNASLLDRNMTLKQGRRRFYHVMEVHGITRKDLGVTAHGLRHERLNDVYEELTGLPSPVRGGTVRAEKETEDYARTVVTEMAGHNRMSVGGAYYGPLRGLPRVSASAVDAPAPPHEGAARSQTQNALDEACKEDLASGAAAPAVAEGSALVGEEEEVQQQQREKKNNSGPPTSAGVGERESTADTPHDTPVRSAIRRGRLRRWHARGGLPAVPREAGGSEDPGRP